MSRAGWKNKSLRKYSVTVRNQGKPGRKATGWFYGSLGKPWSADVACLMWYLISTPLTLGLRCNFKCKITLNKEEVLLYWKDVKAGVENNGA